MSSADKRTTCEITRRICNPARVEFCQCWWESENAEHFRLIALKRINGASLAVKGIRS